MRINGLVGTTSITATSSTPRIAETKATQSAFGPNKREALENRLNRQQEQINRLKKELEAAQDRSGFNDFMAGLFGSDGGAAAAEKQNSTSNATSVAVGAAAGVAAAMPPVGTSIGAAINAAAAAIGLSQGRQEPDEAKDNGGGFGNLVGSIFLGPLVGTAIGQPIGGAATDGAEDKAVFDPADRYTGVHLQQGRVALDADWSESETRKTRKKKPD